MILEVRGFALQDVGVDAVNVCSRPCRGAVCVLVIYPGFSMAAPSSPTATDRRASGTAEGGWFQAYCLRWEEWAVELFGG